MLSRLECADLGLLDFVERASEGRMRAPVHLAGLVGVLERARGLQDVRAVVAAPVQHGKTSALLYDCALTLLKHHERHIIYVSFAQRFSDRQSRAIRQIFTACGGELQADHNTIQEWRTTSGGGLLSASVGGELTGHPATHVVFDDPYKNREEAESPEWREKVEEIFSAAVTTRVAPNGSIVVVASRWHEEDLSGRLVRGEIGGGGFEHVHLRAIETDEHGEERALCPWGPDPKYPRTLEFLRKLRAGRVSEYDWASLYQGDPRPKSGGLFRDVALAGRGPIDASVLHRLGLRLLRDR
jgi:hypothetical protein